MPVLTDYMGAIKMKKQIVDVQTGEVYERDFTAEELAQYELDKAASDAMRAKLAEEEIKREAALSKLAALGLTADDFKALGL